MTASRRERVLVLDSWLEWSVSEDNLAGQPMSLLTFAAKQLRTPSGLFGRLVTSRVLNRGNEAMNQLTLKCLELKPDDAVIEVGFGGGYLISQIATVAARGHIA